MSDYSFSPSQIAFYANALKETYYEPAGQWPDDAFLVTDAVTNEYTVMAPMGKQLGVADGQPAWVDIPALTQTEIEAVAESKKSKLRAVADAEIVWRQDASDAGIATDEETAALAEWKRYRVLLMRVDLTAPDWPIPPGQQAS